MDQIRLELGMDLTADADFYAKVLDCDRIVVDYETKTLSYKPAFDFRTKLDFVEYLHKKAIKHEGLELRQVKETFLDIKQATRELEAEGKVMVLRKADGQPKVVFWNNEAYNTPMEREFRAMWHNLRPPPSQYQVRQELLNEGHQSKTEALGVVSKSSKKKEKKEANVSSSKDYQYSS